MLRDLCLCLCGVGNLQTCLSEVGTVGSVVILTSLRSYLESSFPMQIFIHCSASKGYTFSECSCRVLYSVISFFSLSRLTYSPKKFHISLSIPTTFCATRNRHSPHLIQSRETISRDMILLSRICKWISIIPFSEQLSRLSSICWRDFRLQWSGFHFMTKYNTIYILIVFLIIILLSFLCNKDIIKIIIIISGIKY